MKIVSSHWRYLKSDPVLLVGLEIEVVKVDLGLVDSLHEGALLVHDEDRGEAALTPEASETFNDCTCVLCFNHLDVDKLTDGITEHHRVVLDCETLPQPGLTLVAGHQSVIGAVQV